MTVKGIIETWKSGENFINGPLDESMFIDYGKIIKIAAPLFCGIIVIIFLTVFLHIHIGWIIAGISLGTIGFLTSYFGGETERYWSIVLAFIGVILVIGVWLLFHSHIIAGLIIAVPIIIGIVVLIKSIT
jgi:hypothetical protein